MKLTVSKSQNDIKDQTGGGYINKSGIYDVTLNYVQVAETKNKAYQLNFNVTHQGMDQTIYGPIIVNTDGNVNEITQGLLNRLCIIAGMDDGEDIETETQEYPLGKDQKMTEIEVIPQLCGVDVKMRVQMEYSLYNNQIQERKVVKAFYREDGATAAEATSGEDIGKRLALDEEKYASNVTYKDGLTEQDVEDWIKSRMNGNPSSSAPTPKVASKAPRPMFGKKS